LIAQFAEVNAKFCVSLAILFETKIANKMPLVPKIVDKPISYISNK
jgi:hypothetical protein